MRDEYRILSFHLRKRDDKYVVYAVRNRQNGPGVVKEEKEYLRTGNQDRARRKYKELTGKLDALFGDVVSAGRT